MSKTNNSPSLPPGWVLADLSAIAQINPPLDRCVINDAVPVHFVPMKAVEPEGSGLARPEICTYGEVKKGYTPFLSGDVIMAKITPCMENGKTTVVPDLPDAVCFGSTEFHVFRPEQGISPHWLSYYLLQSNFRKLARMHMAGSAGQLRVPAPFLDSVQIPLAPLSEQQRILEKVEELLSDLDAGVAALERVGRKLSHYRAAMLKAAMEGLLTAEWRQQHPNVEPAAELLTSILAERRRHWEEEQLRKFGEVGKVPAKNWKSKYKEPVAPAISNLPKLPHGWCWATLDQLTDFITSGSRSWKNYYSDAGALFIRSQDIRTDRLDLAEVAHVMPPVGAEGTRTQVQRSDLLVTITGANVAKAAVVGIEIPEAYVSQHVGLMRFVAPELGDFIHIYATAPSGGRKQLLKVAYGAGKPGLNLDNLRELPIPLPPNGERVTLVELVEGQLTVIEHLENDLKGKMKAVQALRQSILRDAFNGELISQDPNDEPASELLKRIAAEREERQRHAISAKRSSVKTKQSRKRAAAI